MEHFGTPPWYSCCAFCLFLALLVHAILIRVKLTTTAKKPQLKLPRGPWQLPLIGSVHHLLRGAPHRILRDLAQRHGPLMLLRICERAAVVVSSAEAAREVFQDAGFEQRPGSPGIDELYARSGMGVVFEPHGDRWRLLRRVLVEALLGAQRVDAFRRVREDEAAQLVASVAASTSHGRRRLVSVDERVAEFVADSAVRAIFGGGLPDRAAFLRMMEQALDFSSIFDLRDLFPSSRLVRLLPRSGKAERNRREAARLMDEILRHREDRRTAGGGGEQDLIDVLLRIHKEGAMGVSLTRGAIVAVLVDVFVAANEATTSTLRWAMAELMANPRVMEKAQAEILCVLAGQERVHEVTLSNLSYLNAVIKETLRLHPPIPLVPRVCLDDRKVQGYDVPKGTPVLFSVWAISRDPRYWEEPDKFMPERFQDEHSFNFLGLDFEFIPFGAGRRACPGIMFSHANVKIALASLLYHFDWELPAGLRPDEMDMEDFSAVAVRRKAGLLLRPIPRSCSTGL